MDEFKKLAARVIEARRNMPADLDPNSPEAIIKGSGSITMGPEEMTEFVAKLQEEMANIQAVSAAQQTLPFVLFILLASLIFGFIGFLVYRLIRSIKGKELKQTEKQAQKAAKKQK